jgi:hydroxymethylbilane synthase
MGRLMRVRIAARSSALARIQAYQVGDALQRTNPHLVIEYSFRESLGDRNQNDPLWQLPDKGVFTQDFREDLVEGRCDLAVHSWKDLAFAEQSATEVVATLARADMRDTLLVRADHWAQILRTGVMKILTSSPRRAYNLEGFLLRALPAEIKHLEFVPVRGNVPTRVKKIWNPGADGLVVAKAALDRLLESEAIEFAEMRSELRDRMGECRWMVLPLSANPTAPGQGALAIEVASGRTDLQELLAPLNCKRSFAAVTREREILRAFGGGCYQKIGVSVLQRTFGEIIFLRGTTDSGETLDSCSLNHSHPLPCAMQPEEIWPRDVSEAKWFTRDPVPADMPDSTRDLWISRADAFRADWTISSLQIIWASGVKTWQGLAERGVWVNGCADGLGEHELPVVDSLSGRKARWLKLTHAGANGNGGMATLATYQLTPQEKAPVLEGRKYFFWTSGSSFERALKLNPWLKGMTHFCGPGNTRRTLEQNGIKPIVFLSHDQWLKEMQSR